MMQQSMRRQQEPLRSHTKSNLENSSAEKKTQPSSVIYQQQLNTQNQAVQRRPPLPYSASLTHQLQQPQNSLNNNAELERQHILQVQRYRSQSQLPCPLNYGSKTSNNPPPALPVASIEPTNAQIIPDAINQAIESQISIMKQQSASAKTAVARRQNVKERLVPTGCYQRYSNQSKKDNARNSNLSALDMVKEQSHGGYRLQDFPAQNQINLNTSQGKSGINNNQIAFWNNPSYLNQDPSCFEHRNTSAAVESQMTLTNSFSSPPNKQCNSEVTYSTHLGPNELQRGKQSNNIYPTQNSTALQQNCVLKSRLTSENTFGFNENINQYPASKINNLIETSIAGGNVKNVQGINISPNEWIDDIDWAARVYIAYKRLEPFAIYEKKVIDAINTKNTNSTKRMKLTQKLATPLSVVVDLTEESEKLSTVKNPEPKALFPRIGGALVQILNEDTQLNLQQNHLSTDNTLTFYSEKGVYNMKASVDTQKEKSTNIQSKLDSFLGINIEGIDTFSVSSPSLQNGKGSRVDTESKARHEKKKKTSNNKLNPKKTKLKLDKHTYSSTDTHRKKGHRDKKKISLKKNKKTVEDKNQDGGKRPNPPMKVHLKKCNVEEGFKSSNSKSEAHVDTSGTNKSDISESLVSDKKFSIQENHIVGCIIHTSSFSHLNNKKACSEVSAVGNALTDKSTPNENIKKVYSPKIMQEIDIFKPKSGFKRSLSLNRKKLKLKSCFVKLTRLNLSDLVKNNVSKKDILHMFPSHNNGEPSGHDKSNEGSTLAKDVGIVVPHRPIELQTTSHQRTGKPDEIFRTVQNGNFNSANGTTLISKEVCDFGSHQTNAITGNVEGIGPRSEKQPHIVKKYNYKQNFGMQLKMKALAKASMHSKIKESVDSSVFNSKLNVSGYDLQAKDENSTIISHDKSLFEVNLTTESMTLPNHNVTVPNFDSLKLGNDGYKSSLKRKPSNSENEQPGHVNRNKKACLGVCNGNVTTEEMKIYKNKFDTEADVLNSHKLNTSPNSNESDIDKNKKQVTAKLDLLKQSTKRNESLSNMIKHAQYLESSSDLNKYSSGVRSNQHSDSNSKIIKSRSPHSNKYKIVSKSMNCQLSKYSNKSKLGDSFKSKQNTIKSVINKMDATSCVNKQACMKLTTQEDTTTATGAKSCGKQFEDNISVSKHSETVKKHCGSPDTVASFDKQKQIHENGSNNKAIEKSEETVSEYMSHDLNKQNRLVQNVLPTDKHPKDKILEEVKNLLKPHTECFSSEDKSSGIGHVTCSLSLSQNKKVYYNEVSGRKISSDVDKLNGQRIGHTYQAKYDRMDENTVDNVESIVKDLVYDSTKNDPRLRPPTYRGYQRRFLEETDVEKRTVLLATKIFIRQDNDLKLPKLEEFICYICKYPFTSREDWSDHLCLSKSKS